MFSHNLTYTVHIFLPHFQRLRSAIAVIFLWQDITVALLVLCCISVSRKEYAVY